MTPQNLVILQGFQPNQPIVLRISDIAMMQIVDLAYPQLHEKISGIDRIYIAPEIMNSTPDSENVVTGKADVWSLGVIMFILISGGMPENNSEQIVFDLQKLLEQQVSPELVSFVEECLNPNPEERPSTKDLERHIFIQNHKRGALKAIVQDYEEEGEESINCYKLQISCVMDEIIHRQCSFNATKLRLVQNIEDDFIKALQHERYASQNASFNGEGNNSKENTIQFKVVRELIRHQLDSFETERLLKPLPVYEE